MASVSAPASRHLRLHRWPCASLPGPQSTYLFKEGVVAAMLGALQHKPHLATCRPGTPAQNRASPRPSHTHPGFKRQEAETLVELGPQLGRSP